MAESGKVFWVAWVLRVRSRREEPRSAQSQESAESQVDPVLCRRMPAESLPVDAALKQRVDAELARARIFSESASGASVTLSFVSPTSSLSRLAVMRQFLELPSSEPAPDGIVAVREHAVKAKPTMRVLELQRCSTVSSPNPMCR
ncbi:unnamed protein product [Prorocentrum cordatum]|uniref:Uncharacterized protein n=1 Tax=Prorocentrum cordatum TaxID=2364126 RepID=A0ABN9QIQ7_9DINO|nr:unnamed protein product [Polarella glacialis]